MKTRSSLQLGAVLLVFLTSLAAAEPRISRIVGSAPLRTTEALMTQPSARTTSLRAQLSAKLKPAGRDWVVQQGHLLAHGNKDVTHVRSQAKTELANLSITSDNGDIEALVYLVMCQAVEEAQSDLKAIMAQTKAHIEEKKQTRERVGAAKNQNNAPGDPLDSLSELSEQQQLKLQSLMDERQKAEETVSNILKKQSDTASSIASNLK